MRTKIFDSVMIMVMYSQAMQMQMQMVMFCAPYVT